MISIPSVGSVVRVTTRYRNAYIFDDTEFRCFTYEGTVVPSEKFDPPGSFCITGDSRMPIRNIALEQISNLEVLTGSARKTKLKSDVRVFRVKSGTNVYTVTMQQSRFQCSCIGYQYRRYCRHAKAVAAKVGM